MCCPYFQREHKEGPISASEVMSLLEIVQAMQSQIDALKILIMQMRNPNK